MVPRLLIGVIGGALAARWMGRMRHHHRGEGLGCGPRSRFGRRGAGRMFFIARELKLDRAQRRQLWQKSLASCAVRWAVPRRALRGDGHDG